MTKKLMDIKPRIEDYEGRKPPQAIDIEEAVLGAMLLESDVVTDLLSQLTVESFYKRPHQLIFAAMAVLASGNNPVDIFTVSDELARQGNLDEVGGSAYLSQLSTKIGSAAHVDFHAQILQEKYLQREMISVAYNVLHDAFDSDLPAMELINHAQDQIFQLEEHGARSKVISIKTALSRTLDRISTNQEREDGLSGLPSGYVDIDRMTFGWQPGDLVILAARPSVGKTAFALTMARNMAVDHNIPVAFFSTEMSSEQLMTRLLISEAGLSAEKLSGVIKMSQREWGQLNNAIGRLEKVPFSLDVTGSISIHEFRSKARRLVSRDHVKIIIVDYLQHMVGPANSQSREQEVAAISRILKDIAIELNIPVIALSQLSRELEKRGGGKRPQLSDLRDSGAIEQDADIVMFLYRPEYHGLQDETSFPGETDVIIAKHRNGETGDVKMRFVKSECRFVDYNDFSSGEANYVPSRMNQ
jgi:replicative DNA helicase